MIGLNKKFISPALMLTLLPAMFRFGSEGLTWFWSNSSPVPMLLLPVAAVFWVLCLKPHGRVAAK
ncbi:MAG: hypothetical protein WBW92_01540 [Rhodanobacteraceae bacterium]